MKTPRFIGSGKQVPPLKEHVLIYFLEKGVSENVGVEFFRYYDGRHWKNNRLQRLSNWKTAAWEWDLKNQSQQMK